MANKFLSRKFLIALSGIISGIVLLVNGEIAAGTSSIIAAVVSYLVAEGIIDAAAVKKLLEEENG